MAEAVKTFGISRRTLDRWVVSGRIPTHQRDDGEVAISREQLANMVARRYDLDTGNNGDPAEA
ncbi:MAG TPA: hypothetical protein VHT75_07680 [Acidimicrobiales bacterium]|nr:hypothetical protein [Acidimicrobiales bacterium]